MISPLLNPKLLKGERQVFSIFLPLPSPCGNQYSMDKKIVSIVLF
jgi:hypothetical protein